LSNAGKGGSRDGLGGEAVKRRVAKGEGGKKMVLEPIYKERPSAIAKRAGREGLGGGRR